DAIDPLSDVSTGLFLLEGAAPPTSVVASVESFTTNPATPDAVPNEPKTPGPNESESYGFLPTPTSFTPGPRGPNPLSKSSQSLFVSAPVFTPAQIEAIIAGDFEGMVETPDVDIEDKMIPVSVSDIEYQLRKIRDRRKDPKHEDLANVIMKTLKRNLTDEERLTLEAPNTLDDPDRWLQWFETTLNTCEEAKRASRNFSSDPNPKRRAIVAAIRCFTRRQIQLQDADRVNDLHPNAIVAVTTKSAVRTGRIKSTKSVRFGQSAEYKSDHFGTTAQIRLADLKKTRMPGRLWRTRHWTTPSRDKLISETFEESVPGVFDPGPKASDPVPTDRPPDLEFENP
ncbi:unnamed protein product, partial [Aphanomyces euteiches]